MQGVLTPEAMALIVAVFLASTVEVVEALTIVLAMGLTRSWRAAVVGTILALIALATITTALGVTLKDYVSRELLQFFIGTLLLVFGLQWLRKAILRASGLKAVHDEDRIFKEKQEAAMKASDQRHFGLDWFAFVVSFKGVFLEGTEVVFIVLTFGLGAQAKGVAHALPLAAAAALLAAVIVLAIGAVARHPLSRVPENTMKFAVGLLLSTFGTFWAVEGMGYFRSQGGSIEWPVGDWTLLILLAIWLGVSQATVATLRHLTRRLKVAPALTPDDKGGSPA